MAQALPYLGAAVGFVVSGFNPMGAQAGFMLGSLAAGVVDPQKTAGPRLLDLRVQTSNYGRALPVLFGTQRIAGNVVWALPLRETTHDSGGKGGGPAITNFSYFATAAVAVCEGPITGIRRIWADGKILYDNSTASTAISATGASPFAIEPSDAPADPAHSVPAVIEPFTSLAGTWTFDAPGLSDAANADYAYLDSSNWSEQYPAGTTFADESTVRTAIAHFWARHSISSSAGYVFTYTSNNTVIVSNIDNIANVAAVSVTLGINHSATPRCPDGYAYNAVTQSCDPVFAPGSAGGAYSLLSSNSTKFASPVAAAAPATTRALTPTITLYRGTEDQLPDPAMQAALGAKSTPAFRGTAYVVLTDFPVDTYGNRLPNLEFEVITHASSVQITTPIPGSTSGTSTTGFAYDVTRGTLWHVSAGDGLANDYTRLDVNTKARSVGKISKWAAAAFKAAGLARYDAGTDALYLTGTQLDSPCLARVSPDAGVVTNIITPTLRLPEHASGICVDSKRKKIWVVGRFNDGRLGICTVEAKTGVTVFVTKIDDGSTAVTCSVNGNANSAEYCEKSDTVWVGYTSVSRTTGAQSFKIVAYDAATLTQKTTIPATGAAWFVAEPSSGNVLFFDGARTCVYDNATGAVSVATAAPVAGATADGTGGLGLIVRSGGGTLATFDSTGAFTGKLIPATDSVLANGFDAFADSRRGMIVSNAGFVAVDRIDEGSVTVADVFLDIARRVKIPASMVDVSDVGGADCRIQGFGILNRTAARTAFEPLQQAYGLDVVDTGDKIRVTRRAEAPYYGVIPWSDQAAHTDTGGNDYVAPLASVRAHDLELPSTVEVTFDDPGNEYLQNLCRAKKQATASSVDARVISLPMTIPAPRAQAIATMLLSTAWLGRTTFELTVGLRHLGIDPGDVIDIDKNDGSAVRAIVTRVSFSPSGLIKLSCAAFDYATYGALAGVATFTPVVARTVENSTAPRLLLLDAPVLSSADDYSGFYAASIPAAGNSTATRAAIYTSSDDSNYTLLAAAGQPAVAGISLGELSAPAVVELWDLANTITVNLFAGALYSATNSDVLNGTNLAILGGEVLQFAVAVENDDGSYTLSKLLRGRRGTEAKMTHEAGETFVLLNSAVQRIKLLLELTGVERYYKIVGQGQPLDASPSQAFTNTDVGLECYAPVKLTATRNDAADIATGWVRRTRVAGELRDRVDVPLSESTEAYDVEVLTESGSVIRTATVSTPAWLYTAAQQVADFGAARPAVTLRIYQLSATMGRGNPLTGTV